MIEFSVPCLGMGMCARKHLAVLLRKRLLYLSHTYELISLLVTMAGPNVSFGSIVPIPSGRAVFRVWKSFMAGEWQGHFK